MEMRRKVSFKKELMQKGLHIDSLLKQSLLYILKDRKEIRNLGMCCFINHHNLRWIRTCLSRHLQCIKSMISMILFNTYILF